MTEATQTDNSPKKAPTFLIRVKEDMDGQAPFKTVAAIWENDNGQMTGRTSYGQPITLTGTFYLVRPKNASTQQEETAPPDEHFSAETTAE